MQLRNREALVQLLPLGPLAYAPGAPYMAPGCKVSAQEQLLKKRLRALPKVASFTGVALYSSELQLVLVLRKSGSGLAVKVGKGSRIHGCKTLDLALALGVQSSFASHLAFYSCDVQVAILSLPFAGKSKTSCSFQGQRGWRGARIRL